MKVSSFLKPLSFLPALALMYMIYSFSSQPADSSSSTSFYVSRKIVQAVDLVTRKNWDDWEIDQHATQIHGIVRKGAHVTEYFLLAIAVSFPLYVYGVRGILLMILAGMICVAYACGDEYHQSLVDGRAASSRDVLIDSVGILFGIILTRLIGWSGRMAITGPMYERRQNQKQRELDAREEELSRREAALRREEMRYQRARAGHEADSRSRSIGSSHEADSRTRNIRSSHEVDDRTRVIGTSHEVDDRTRVYRSEEEQRRMEEAYRKQVCERRRVQSEELQEDSTSDQLSEDLPFSRLFRKKE